MEQLLASGLLWLLGHVNEAVAAAICCSTLATFAWMSTACEGGSDHLDEHFIPSPVPPALLRTADNDVSAPTVAASKRGAA